jgi:phage-related protein
MSWIITFYNEQVERKLLEWPAFLRAKRSRILDLIREYGANLGMPLTRVLGDGLFEIRESTKMGEGRIFFTYKRKQEIIVLHSFIKKTRTTPKKELQIAQRRLQKVLKDYE